MKKILIILSLILLTSCQGEDRIKLKVLTSMDYPPFEMKDGEDYIGFDMDLIREIARRMDVDVYIVNNRFDSIFTKLFNEEADLAISAISKTEQRDELVDFSIPYFYEYDVNRDVLLVKKDSNIQGFQDLEDKELGVESGTIQSQLASISQGHFKYAISIYTLIDNGVQALANNEIDALLLEVQYAETILSVNDDLMKVDLENCFDSCNYGYVIAFPQNSAYIEEVNTIIQELIDEGYIDELKEKWLE